MLRLLKPGIIVFFISYLFASSAVYGGEPGKSPEVLKEHWIKFATLKYVQLKDSALNFQAFQEGIQGYFLLKKANKLKNERYLTVIDFSLASNQKRFFLIDMEQMKVVHKTYCSHGKNTGGLYANSFSNTHGSNQSSLGFYITAETYHGKFDLGLRLDGVESVNDKARSRGVVMHGAEYATEKFLQRNNGVLGRSFGCPAVPKDEADLLINKIKGGSVMYIYYPDKAYHKTSKMLNNFQFVENDETYIRL
jgi:hypothetical protein